MHFDLRCFSAYMENDATQTEIKMYSKCDDSRGIKRFEYIYCFLLCRINMDQRNAQVYQIGFPTHAGTHVQREQLNWALSGHIPFWLKNKTEFNVRCNALSSAIYKYEQWTYNVHYYIDKTDTAKWETLTKHESKSIGRNVHCHFERRKYEINLVEEQFQFQ